VVDRRPHLCLGGAEQLVSLDSRPRRPGTCGYSDIGGRLERRTQPSSITFHPTVQSTTRTSATEHEAARRKDPRDPLSWADHIHRARA
jgi:hypothetical protein